MSWQQVRTETQHFPSRFEISDEVPDPDIGLHISGDILDDEAPDPDIGLHISGDILDNGEEDEIDLEGYEEYLEHLKSKAVIRPCSARIVRPMPMESPQFFMTNSDNPIPTRPTRPVSARPRMRSTPRNSLDNGTLNGSQSRSSGMGVRRKRQGENLVHARIRAVYNDVGRSFRPMKQVSCSAKSAFNSKSNRAEMHDEYYRLLDAESELKAAYLQEQQKRVKAVAHVRRLEEILAMKDKKIESLLHAKAVGADRSLNTNRTQREIAERDRQFHALTQKLRQKIAQQSQLLSSYEEAMQSLRSGIKSTNLMELEEERSQLYQELRYHQELLDRQRLEWEVHQQKLVGFAETEASSKLQIAKLQQENKIIAHEKRKLAQEVGFLKSRVELLQSHLTLEQRKRTYDREFSESIGKHTLTSPTQKVMLAQALEEMKKLARKETAASIKREKLKSPNTGSILTHPDMVVSPAFPKHPRPSSATSIYSDAVEQGTKIDDICADTAPISPHNFQDQGKPGSEQFDLNLGQREQAGCSESKESVMPAPQPADQILHSNEAQPINIFLNDKDIEFSGTNVKQDSLQTETSEPSEKARSLTTSRIEPGCGKQTDNAHCTSTEDENGVHQITDEEMSEMQQQKLADIANVLRLDIDDDADSELSADMLDDAQNLRSDPEMKKIDSIDDVADADLINFVVSKEYAGVEVKEEATSLPIMTVALEEALQEDSQEEDQLSDALDDLYPSDFLATDA